MIPETDIYGRYWHDVTANLAETHLSGTGNFLGGDDLIVPLLETMYRAPFTAGGLRVLEQFQNTLPLRQYLPRRCFLTLLGEAAMSRVLANPPADFIDYTKIDGPFLSSRRQVLVQKDYPHPEFVNQVQNTLDWAIDFSLHTPADGPLIDLQVPGVANEVRAANHDELIRTYRDTSLLFMTKERFYDLIPGGDLLRAEYGPKFWVLDLALNNSLVYTDVAAQEMQQHPYLRTSNILHEIIGHVGMANTYGFQCKFGEKLYRLNPLVAYPTWFVEGAANWPAMRFTEFSLKNKTFLDLALDGWDGKIPESDEIVKCDTNMKYIWPTMFSAFSLKALIQKRQSPDEPFDMDIWNPVFWPGGLLRTMSHKVAIRAPEDPADIAEPFIEAVYAEASSFLHHRYPAEYKSPINFQWIKQEWDRVRYQYFDRWMNAYATRTRIKQSHSAQKRNEPDMPHINVHPVTKLLDGYNNWGDHPQDLRDDFLRIDETLADSQSPTVNKVLHELHEVWEIAPYIPLRAFHRLLSELWIANLVDPEPDQKDTRTIIDHQRETIRQKILRYYRSQVPPDIKAVHLERGFSIDDLATHPYLTGTIFTMDASFKDLAMQTMLYHLDSITGLTGRVFRSYTEDDFPYSGRRSVAELYALSSGQTPEGILQIVLNTNYAFIPLESYYAALPILKQTDHSMFWVRDHPVSGTIVYTDRTQELGTNRTKGLFTNWHENEHLIQGEVLPVFVTAHDNDEVLRLNSVLILPPWWTEGSVNVNTDRFTWNPAGKEESYWHYAFRTLPQPIELPESADILAADTKMPYLYFSPFTGGLLQLIDERSTETRKRWLPSVPDMQAMKRGYYMFIEAANHTQPLLLPNKLPFDLGNKYIDHLLQAVSRHFDISVPTLQQYCFAYDQGKNHWWNLWQEVFAPK